MTRPINSLHRALPFWTSLGLIPAVWAAAVFGGWALLSVPLYTWVVFSILDAVGGLETSNSDINTPDSDLFWYRLITLIWAPLQALTMFATLAYITNSSHLAAWEKLGVAYGLGIMAGTIGIVYAHELMHQNSKVERWLADILMAMAQYGHFRSEHLLVHHAYVATPRDAVTARYNEGFHRFFARVLPGSLRSAWHAEATRFANAIAQSGTQATRSGATQAYSSSSLSQPSPSPNSPDLAYICSSHSLRSGS